jgi:hypothetical protein
MTKYLIAAPQARFNGEFAGLVFRAGEAAAETPADQAAVTYCQRRGYIVEPVDTSTNDASEENGDAEGPIQPRSGDPKADWVAYAANHPDEKRRLSLEDAEALTKAELVELYGK